MPSVTVEQRFAGAPSATWQRISDVASYPGVVDSYLEVRFETDARQGPGARWSQTRRVFGREHAQTMEVQRWEPERLLVLTASEGGARYESRYELQPEGEGTRVRLTFSATPEGWLAGLFMRLMGAKLIASTGEAMARDLAQLAGGGPPADPKIS